MEFAGAQRVQVPTNMMVSGPKNPGEHSIWELIPLYLGPWSILELKGESPLRPKA